MEGWSLELGLQGQQGSTDDQRLHAASSRRSCGVAALGRWISRLGGRDRSLQARGPRLVQSRSQGAAVRSQNPDTGQNSSHFGVSISRTVGRQREYHVSGHVDKAPGLRYNTIR